MEEYDLDPSPSDSGGVSRLGHPKSTDRATAQTNEDELKAPPFVQGTGARRRTRRRGGRRRAVEKVKELWK